MTHDLELAALESARAALRAMLALPGARARALQKVEDFQVPGPVGPLRARYYEPASSVGAPLMLYFHGGGFVMGDIDTHDGLTSYLAQAAGARLVSVGYRLAPEAAFPAQLEDALAAARWALGHAKGFGAAPEKIVPCGDSAGAYLAARCALELNAAEPGAAPLQVLFYPLVHVHDALWADEELRNFRFIGRLAVRYIARSLDAAHVPSLLDFDLKHAPTAIIAGGGPLDPVRADVKTLAGALAEVGVRVIEKKYPALMHGGLNFTAASKFARQALEEVGALARAELS